MKCALWNGSKLHSQKFIYYCTKLIFIVKTFSFKVFCGCVHALKYFYVISTNFIRITVLWIINKLPCVTSDLPSLISASDVNNTYSYGFVIFLVCSNPPSLFVYCFLLFHALLGVVTIDDDRKIDPDDILFGFKVWQVSIKQ